MKLNEFIDYTLLSSHATSHDIQKICVDAEKHKFASVCVNPIYVSHAKNLLKKTKVNVCTVVGFPLGSVPTNIKVLETEQAVRDGADEIDMVINVGALKEGAYTVVLNDIKHVRAVCPKQILKVIIETALLTKEEKIQVCKLALQAQADFIKTSTGFAKSGAKVKDIKLIRSIVKDEMCIKASGKIKTKAQAIKLIKGGADRLGISKAALLMV
ncbi:MULTISPECIES: deoxyribose-phosphate aldolase [unclassified Spiroplasma]|uniref:deoxyribose-phosphate aldolase n=1 Tax=unclassified Spiroplasma TaxID=2637901 RepID=UPI00313B750C